MCGFKVLDCPPVAGCIDRPTGSLIWGFDHLFLGVAFCLALITVASITAKVFDIGAATMGAYCFHAHIIFSFYAVFLVTFAGASFFTNASANFRTLSGAEQSPKPYN